MKLTVADMKKVVSLEDVLYVLEGHYELERGVVEVDTGDQFFDVPFVTAQQLVREMYEFAEER